MRFSLSAFSLRKMVDLFKRTDNHEHERHRKQLFPHASASFPSQAVPTPPIADHRVIAPSSAIIARLLQCTRLTADQPVLSTHTVTATSISKDHAPTSIQSDRDEVNSISEVEHELVEYNTNIVPKLAQGLVEEVATLAAEGEQSSQPVHIDCNEAVPKNGNKVSEYNTNATSEAEHDSDEYNMNAVPEAEHNLKEYNTSPVDDLGAEKVGDSTPPSSPTSSKSSTAELTGNACLDVDTDTDDVTSSTSVNSDNIDDICGSEVDLTTFCVYSKSQTKLLPIGTLLRCHLLARSRAGKMPTPICYRMMPVRCFTLKSIPMYHVQKSLAFTIRSQIPSELRILLCVLIKACPPTRSGSTKTRMVTTTL